MGHPLARSTPPSGHPRPIPMLIRLLLPALLLAAPTTAQTAAPAAEAPAAQVQQPETVSASQLKSAADRSVRYLRTQQDLETGRYGSLLDTAVVLNALAQSPRAYKYQDGPYVALALDSLLASQGENGAFGAGELEPEEVSMLTLAALGPLAAYPEGEAALARALAHLGPDAQVPSRSAMDLNRARLAGFALMSAQAPDGSWQGLSSNIRSTAVSLTVISSAHATLSAAESDGAAVEVRPLPAFDTAERGRIELALARGASFLAESAGADGLWGAMGNTDAGITAMVAGALQTGTTERSAEHLAAIERALAHLRQLAKEDGSIHAGQLQSYVTSASILALAKAANEQDAALIQSARAYLGRLQADGAEGYDESHPYYGGVGYGGDERPDLSNLQMALDALVAAGGTSEDEAFRKALVFLQRSQNRTESNDLELEVDGVQIRPGNDGGAGYAPGESKAGFIELADGTKIPRSYGSMTYGLLRGYLFAGLSKDDPRVEAAWRWISANYTLDLNPGFETSSDPAAPYQGLFYYFHSMAKALDVYGAGVVVDAAGAEHDWRTELAGRLLSLQRPDGSWLNENSPRWWEGNPVLATSYAMLTLEIALRE